MSALIRIALVLVLALASPAFAERVLLADADPELQRAVKATLAPWRLEVVIDNEPPADETHAQMRGDAQTARFVVWRENGELVVFDRERGAAEHREAPAGQLDAASAAAAALTVKTLMRLPPPDQVAEATPPIEPIVDQPVVADEPSHDGLRLQGAIATRMTRGDDNRFGARGALAVLWRPTTLPLRFGIAGEYGTSADIQGSGFKGTWNDWSVIALASYALPLAPRWEIEPYVGAGVLRSMLDGDEQMTERHERETLALVRAGTFIRLRAGRLSVGGTLGIDATIGTPAYTRMGMGSQFFEVPPFALSIGFIVAADLSR